MRKKTSETQKRLVDDIIYNAPKDVPLTDEEIQAEVNAVRYPLSRPRIDANHIGKIAIQKF